MFASLGILLFEVTTVLSQNRPTNEKTKDVALQVPPTLSKEFGSGNAAYFRNSTSFFCKASGNPQPKIYWKRYSKYLRRKRYKVVNHKNDVSELIINPVLKADDGYFKCVAENGIGKPATVSYQLHVLYDVPDIPANISYVSKYRAHVLNTGIVICYVTGSPRPNVTWERNGKQINTRLKRYTVVFDIDTAKYMYTSQLRITPVRAADNGKYTCVAKNGIGESDRRNGSIIIYKDVEAPRRVKLKVLNSTAILVTWKPPRRHKLNRPFQKVVHGFIVSWLWNTTRYKYERAGIRYLEWSETNQSRYAGNTHSFLLTNLESNKRYNISVGSWNKESYYGVWSKGKIAKTPMRIPYKAPTLYIKGTKSTMIYVWIILPKEMRLKRIYKGFYIYYQEINPLDESVGEELVMDFVPKGPYSDSPPIRNLKPYTTYAIQAAAYNRKGVGIRSERRIANTTGPEPSAPTNLSAVVLSEGTGHVLLSWSPPIVTNGEITQYELSWKSSKDEDFDYEDLPAGNQTFVFDSLEKGRKYTFQVSAVNENGFGPEASVTVDLSDT